MKVVIVQADIVWEKPAANLERLEAVLLEAANDKADMVVLPEMFSTGFSMNSASLAETMDENTVSWMKSMAARGGFALAGSMIVKEENNFYNRLVICTPDGILATYDKGHLFRMEKENLSFTKGDRRVICDYMNFSINLQICYDLRFPVWNRNVANNYDILLNVANWPEARQDVWNTLLVARAIENQCYVIGVNRVGVDGTGISYCGDSVIIDPKGRTIASLEPGQEGTASAILSLAELQSFREKFPVWKDADSFSLL